MQVKKISKKGKKYKIVLDLFTIDTYEEVILKYNLLYKKDINLSLAEKIKEENKYYENYYKVLDLINKRLRSEYEIVSYLEKNNCKEAGKIIKKLKEIGFINDEDFAKAYVNDKINLSLDGPNKIKSNLIHLKVDSDIIDKILNNIDEDVFRNHLKKLVEKKSKTIKYTGNILKNKLFIYLSNMGYPSCLINEELNNLKVNDLSSEMEKIYNKLKLKYEGDTLKYKLKSKLYSKGFSSDEINSFIDNNL